VVPRLDEFNPVSKNSIDNTMFLVNSPAPTTGEIVTERLRFADSPKWIGKDRCHQVKNPNRGFAVCLNPEPQVLAEVC